MSSQRTLDFDGLDGEQAAQTPEERFAQFDRAHPKIWARIVFLCRQRLDDGHRVWGMKAVFEEIRWNHPDIRTSAKPFKINNNHAPHYVRKLQRTHPALAALFKTKGQDK